MLTPAFLQPANEPRTAVPPSPRVKALAAHRERNLDVGQQAARSRQAGGAGFIPEYGCFRAGFRNAPTVQRFFDAVSRSRSFLEESATGLIPGPSRMLCLDGSDRERA